MPTLTQRSELPTRPVGRPRAALWSVEAVAALFDLRPEFVQARCELGLLPDAVSGPEGGWVIPEAAVRQMALGRIQPSYTIEQAAGWLGVDYGTLFRRVALVSALGDPLPAGKTVRALPLFLNPGCKPMKRIPEEELLRVMGLNGKGDR